MAADRTPATRTNPRPPPDLCLERQALSGPLAPTAIAGVDEAGRGPLAGPVTAAAVILPALAEPTGGLTPALCAAIADSKTVSEATRDHVAPLIMAQARTALGWASVAEIDRLNILAASLLAMARALAALGAPPPGLALIDGNRLPPDLPMPAQAVVKGDARSLSIAAASILAKSARDAEMRRLAALHPGYGWDRNKGYGTKAHRAAIKILGVSCHHRQSFSPISEQLSLTN